MSPFPTTTASPGKGTIHLTHVPPSSSTLRDLTYQYPLKLIAPSPLLSPSSPHTSVQTLYLLTYGGGLVAGDALDIELVLDHDTRLILLTQGSTKIFKSPARDVVSKQWMRTHIGIGAGLVYLPDPVQPFERSAFEQKQVYDVEYTIGEDGKINGQGSLCALDWVCEGRRARGEKWRVWGYASRNEVWVTDKRERRLLVRDNLALEEETAEKKINGSDGHEEEEQEETPDFSSRMDGMGVFGTLILHGPMFARLGTFFMSEFKLIPRIGGRKWDTSDEQPTLDEAEMRRKARFSQETADGLLWTVSYLRSCFVVKFGAREVEGGKRWLRTMLENEGSVPSQFGERALLCMK